MWTRFSDMHSGGYQKLEYGDIYIELPEAEAAEYFEAKFDRNPYGVTCDCCGSDYWIDTSESSPSFEHDSLVIYKENL